MERINNTMRFIQPDPVHTERTGFDNYDRYSYVNNNPVNFVDPSGESWLSDWINPSRTKRHQNAWKKGLLIGMLVYGEQFITDTMNQLSNFLKENSWLGLWGSEDNPFYRFFRHNQDLLLGMLIQESGLNGNKFLWLIVASMIAESQVEEDLNTFFGHRYTGIGNKDIFGGLYNKYDRHKWLGLFLVGINEFNKKKGENEKISMEEVMWFLLLSSLLRAKPKSYMDKVAQWHDDHYPGGIGYNLGCLMGCRHFGDFLYADMGYISRFISGFTKKEFWDKPIDSILVGGMGSVLFGGIQCMKSIVCAGGIYATM